MMKDISYILHKSRIYFTSPSVWGSPMYEGWGSFTCLCPGVCWGLTNSCDGCLQSVLCGAAMNASDSDDDSYNERTALVPSENPAVPSYRPDTDLTPPNDTPSKRVKIRFLFIAWQHLMSVICEVLYPEILNDRSVKCSCWPDVFPAALTLSVTLCWSSLGWPGGRVRLPWTAAVGARIRRWMQTMRSWLWSTEPSTSSCCSSPSPSAWWWWSPPSSRSASTPRRPTSSCRSTLLPSHVWLLR